MGRPSKSVEIYALTDPRTGAIRYIGKAVNSEKRLKSHIRDSTRRDTPVYRWMRKLLEGGLLPEITVIAVTLGPDWQDTEKALIAQHRSQGRLLNVADGGDEPFCPIEVRAANGKKNSQKRQSNPVKQRIWWIKKMLGDALKRGEVMNSTRAKMRLAAKLRPHLWGLWANIPDRIENGTPV